MSNALPLTIESLVAILLLLTILYCVRLNEQLKRLKADETTMQRTVAELMTATETAERAIAGLKATVQEAEATLGRSLVDAEHYSGELAARLDAAAATLQQLDGEGEARPWLSGVKAEPKAEVEEAAPDPLAIAAAARAFSERARLRLRAA